MREIGPPDRPGTVGSEEGRSGSLLGRIFAKIDGEISFFWPFCHQLFLVVMSVLLVPLFAGTNSLYRSPSTVNKLGDASLTLLNVEEASVFEEQGIVVHVGVIVLDSMLSCTECICFLRDISSSKAE